MNADEIIKEGKRVLEVEIEALTRLHDALGDDFVAIFDEIIKKRGKLVITGMGKPGHIAKKLAATFSSLGTPSFCLHPAEAMHGDLGMIGPEDTVIAISYSGESDEIVKILSNIKLIGATLVAITGNADSTLAKAADLVQVLPKFDEACNLGLAPTSSTTAVLAYGDALAVAASKEYGFNDADFGRFHPAGSLGKRLILRVDDLMAAGSRMASVSSHGLLMEAIKEISKKRLGAVCVVGKDGGLEGIITDGDIRRAVADHKDIYAVTVNEIMTSSPKRTHLGALAIDALVQMKDQNINCLPVERDGELAGMVTWQDIVGAGIVA
ncbi:KpsF/GutQ family sugar-phosphate isomerase [Adlercreutzia caecimuris]|uniref:KpsF/GutQ family sugar-phosphate isomerase n=1 Tax=Adlercreutzia caecimuris TaxID=671266 RepID=UPI00214C9E5E|nr:KpsF/GutQ family sugar-phosphate isomerase [Adlercreutzia caecimuris]MCR2038478.1 KpsF/GutQ family sugar-phosphate isomerase [Adlercreutzia caecimuris]